MEPLAVDVALLPLALVGLALVALGALHLWKTERFFSFYARFNENRRAFHFPGGESDRATRLFGVALVAIGVTALLGAFT
jgi:uncharacterized protein YjeT (DUF2065 family)